MELGSVNSQLCGNIKAFVIVGKFLIFRNNYAWLWNFVILWKLVIILNYNVDVMV